VNQEERCCDRSAQTESADVGAVGVQRMGASAMSARKTSRDTLTVRAPVISSRRLSSVDEELRTTIGGGMVARQLPDEAHYDEARARECKKQTWVERVVERASEDGERRRRRVLGP